MTEPRYDEDLVNKGYIDSLLTGINVEITQLDYNKNFGSSPQPPYYINDTYMDGTDIYICIVERLIGSFNSNDWTIATAYMPEADVETYVAGEIDTLTDYILGITDNLQDQIDNQIILWFYEGVPTLENEPAVNWTTPQLLADHVGDICYNMLTGDSYRFVYFESVYSWLQQSDSQAQAAYTLAEDAMAIADSKRRVFVGSSNPTTPYEVGDLWSYGINNPLKICTTERLTGAYNTLDWTLASNADNTQTVIDGGLITTGTLQVKDGAGNTKAGITGNTASAGDTDVRFWAGATYANKATAPFRVTQAGLLYATGATISGAITATSGSFTGTISSTDASIGGWTVNTTGILKEDTTATSKGMLSNDTYAFYAGQTYGNRGSAPFRVTQAGTLYATSVNITGNITSSSISGGTISGSSIYGTGTVRLYNGVGFLSMNITSDHPWLSALNVNNSNGIHFYNGTAYNSVGSQLAYINTDGSGNMGIHTNGTCVIYPNGGTYSGLTITSYYGGSGVADEVSLNTSQCIVLQNGQAKPGAGGGKAFYDYGGNGTLPTSTSDEILTVGSHSGKAYKKDITKVEVTEEQQLANLFKDIPLSKFVYKDDDNNEEKLGFILEDILAIDNDYKKYFSIKSETRYDTGTKLMSKRINSTDTEVSALYYEKPDAISLLIVALSVAHKKIYALEEKIKKLEKIEKPEKEVK